MCVNLCADTSTDWMNLSLTSIRGIRVSLITYFFLMRTELKQDWTSPVMFAQYLMATSRFFPRLNNMENPLFVVRFFFHETDAPWNFTFIFYSSINSLKEEFTNLKKVLARPADTRLVIFTNTSSRDAGLAIFQWRKYHFLYDVGAAPRKRIFQSFDSSHWK